MFKLPEGLPRSGLYSEPRRPGQELRTTGHILFVTPPFGHLCVSTRCPRHPPRIPAHPLHMYLTKTVHRPLQVRPRPTTDFCTRGPRRPIRVSIESSKPPHDAQRLPKCAQEPDPEPLRPLRRPLCSTSPPVRMGFRYNIECGPGPRMGRKLSARVARAMFLVYIS